MKQNDKLTTSFLLSLICIFGLSVAASAQKEIEKVDSVLDRLEKRILDEEGEGLTFGEKPMNSKDEDRPTIKVKMKGEGSKTLGELPETKQMREIASGISELEVQIDQLTADVQRTRQKILEEARIDNIVLIETKINGADTASLKMLRAKLDGYVIYGVSEEGGLWIPARATPLFSGPLQPGSHRLDVEARIAIRESAKMPLNTDVSRYISQSFELRIPDGKQTTKYTVVIDPSTDGTGRATAKLEEATLRTSSPLPMAKNIEVISDSQLSEKDETKTENPVSTKISKPVEKVDPTEANNPKGPEVPKAVVDKVGKPNKAEEDEEDEEEDETESAK